MIDTKVIFHVTDPHFSSKTPKSRVGVLMDDLLEKMEFVLQEASKEKGIVVITGDFYLRPKEPYFVNTLLFDLFLKYENVKIFGIPGNHDLSNYRRSSAKKLSIGNLFSSGLVKKLGSVELFDGWILVGHKFKEELPICAEKTILATHSYIDSTSKKELLNITTEQILVSKPKIILTGHDHNQYPITRIGETLVVRPGALSRGTISEENKTRIISYSKIDLEFKKITYEPVKVAKPPENVFAEGIKETKLSKIIDFEDVRSFIGELGRKATNTHPQYMLYDLYSENKIPLKTYNELSQLLTEGGAFQPKEISDKFIQVLN